MVISGMVASSGNELMRASLEMLARELHLDSTLSTVQPALLRSARDWGRDMPSSMCSTTVGKRPLKFEDRLNCSSSAVSTVSWPQASSALPCADGGPGVWPGVWPGMGMSPRDMLDMVSPCEASSGTSAPGCKEAVTACSNGEVSLSEAELRHQPLLSAWDPEGLDVCKAIQEL